MVWLLQERPCGDISSLSYIRVRERDFANASRYLRTVFFITVILILSNYILRLDNPNIN